MSCNNKIPSAVITATLAAGSVTSPYFVEVNITQRLCHKTCADNTPVFVPQFSLVGVSAVDTNQYVATVRVQGIISYTPCDGSCCTKQQPLNQVFTIPFFFAGDPTVTITAGASVNEIVAAACHNCSRNFVSETPITLTVTAAA
jgi:hypothetical protein